MPDPSASQSATAGDQSRIIQVHGDNNIIGVSPSLKLIRPLRERPPQTSTSADEAALLVPREEATEFVGRKNLLDEFITWATTTDHGRPVSVRVLTGGAGTGKTRFAMELCRALEQRQGASWQAGFVREREARRFLSQTNLCDRGWQTPTLAVFDYAMTLTDVLPTWMEELADVQDSPRPLRILLLERHADPEAGWLKQVFPGGYRLTGRILDGRPMCLPGLDDPDIQIGIMQDMLKRLGSTVTLPADAPAFRDHLAKADWAGAPLYLMMAAMVIHRQGDVGHVLSLRRADLAKTVSEHEHSRLTRASNGNPSLQRFLSHMAALATLCGGLDGGTLVKLIRQEKHALGHEELGNDTVAHTLKQLLPDGKEGVAPILPDIVGEAFLFEHLGHGQTQASTEAVLRASPKTPAMVAAVLFRCVQDFAPASLTPEDAARAVEQTRAVAWLHALVGLEGISLNMLIVLSNAMPKQTLALRELGVMLAERLVVDLRKLPERNMEQQIAYATSLNNLANRLGELGRREEALDAAQETVAICRELTQTRPDACRPVLGMSLSTLANRLAELGRREEALDAAQEAVAIRRELAQARPDVFPPDLAMSLNNLAIRLAQLGRPEEALDAAQEAVAIRRVLAQARPDAFCPDLAGSLNNLANILSDLGRPEEALDAAQEATELYRELAHTRPDAFRPDLAMSLNTLAIIRARLGRRKEALAAAQEATNLYRELAHTRPDTFRPDLATCLNNLANRLTKLGRHDKALDAAQEAVAIRRELAQARPEAFRPDLAMSLNNLAAILSELGRREEALEPAQESVTIRRELAHTRPDVFRPVLAGSLNNLSKLFTGIGKHEEAKDAAQEAARLYYTVARQ
ncbi:tetratricopeptide repeat protein [Desulfolutivibrio sp.]|uniref:tetratricopeptide repeat protein n=1 Tax=Desulfolutivibrio sp. TaxID=2773296 RepID=UPI002F968CC9